MMSDNENQDLFGQDRSEQSKLLDELDSLKELLDEDISNIHVPATVNEIRTVQEYMQFKQEADAAGLPLDAYLSKRAAEKQQEAAMSEDYGFDEEDEDIDIPTLDEVVAFDDIGEIDDGIDIPVLEEAVEILPVEHVVEQAHVIGAGFSLEEIERVVEHIVQQKLQEIRPQLEKQVFDQIRNMLPVDQFHK